MSTAAPSTALATILPVFTDAGRLALAGFLAGYRGLTRDACALDLRQFTTGAAPAPLALFAVRRADIESFARDLEARGRARATVTRRLCTIAGFCKYAVEEEFLDHSPAAHVRRAIDLAIGERTEGPVFLAAGGRRLDRHAPGGSSVRSPAAPASAKPSRRTHSGTRSSLQFRRGSASARRARGRLACRSADHDPL